MLKISKSLLRKLTKIRRGTDIIDNKNKSFKKKFTSTIRVNSTFISSNIKNTIKQTKNCILKLDFT